MSYILDALRKSDQQRQLGAAPTLHMGQMAAAEPKQAAHLYYGLLAAVLLCAGIAIGWLRPWQAAPSAPPATVAAVQRPEASASTAAPLAPILPAPAAAPAPPVAPAPAVAPATQPAMAISPAPAQPRPAAPAAAKTSAPPPVPVRTPTPAAPAAALPPATFPAPQPAPATAKSQSPAPAKVEIPGKPQDPAAAPARAPAPEPTPAAAPAQNVIWLAELPLALQQELPPMTVSVHAYSARPVDRMVGINNRMLREGEYVANGLKLEQITPEGMVLGYKGYSFRRGVK